MERFLQYPNWTMDVYLAFTVVAVCFGLIGCDSNPPGDNGDNQPPKAVAEASPTDTTTNAEVTFDASGSTDPDDDAGSLTYDWEFGDGDSGGGETTNHTYGSAGEYTAELSVSDGERSETDEVTVSITDAAPDSVAITYRPLDTDGNVLEDAQVTDGAVTGTGEFTDSVAYSTNSREVTAERDGYENGSSTYTPTSSQTVEITLAEKTAEVTVTAEALETEVELSSQLELSADGETKASGVAPLTTEVSVSVDELTVSAAEHEQDSEVYADTSATFMLEDSPVTVGQRRVAHCMNGLDNDGDGLVGIWTDEDGNDIPTEGDSGDPGCTSGSDDNENHRVYTRTGYGGGFNDTTFVSSDPDHWKSEAAYADFPTHIQITVGNIFSSADVKVSSNEDGESFAVRFECGSSINITEIVEDDPSVDGWHSPMVLGIESSWFAESTTCDLITLHKAFIDDDPGDGNDDVIFGYPERTGKTVFSWVYEPDHPDLNKSMAKPETAGPDGVTVRSTGYVDTGRQ
ncbi:MAG: hypothetical protein BRD26_00425 [Bacteroidetes bacterium QH_1_64_81]|nr:MAG: hypothetical protein BRD26_00425 [Bacteroidetes bacterium QH_1_64_81]